MKKINLRKIFDSFNSKVGNRLSCEKIYIIPAMRYWYDDIEKTVVTAVVERGDEKFKIKKIGFNPDLKNSEIKDILKTFLAETIIVGENWDKYIQYKKMMSK